jgi:predicted Zn-dependent peptidase
LYKSLVLEQKIATGAQAGVNGLKYDGYFSVMGVVRPGKESKDLEEALYKEIEVLKSEPVGEREMQKVKNEELASDFRRLRSNFGLMVQLLQYDALGTWQNINRFSDRIQAVTPEDIQRVAKKYFTAENRNVAYFLPKQEQSQKPSEPSEPSGEHK